MLDRNKTIVENYLYALDDEEKADLYFCEEDGSPANLGIKKKIRAGEIVDDDDLLRTILIYKEEFKSKNKITHEIETDWKKHRSSLDIWRHFKFYKPDATLNYVMGLLHKLRDELRIQNCSVIHKRVFDLTSAYMGGERPLRNDLGNYDEYGLTFPNWIAD